jgi:hypothetical protein
VFVVSNAEPETGIALTAIDGEHDHRFLTSWQQLRTDPDLVAELNALKLGFQAREISTATSKPNPPSSPPSKSAVAKACNPNVLTPKVNSCGRCRRKSH